MKFLTEANIVAGTRVFVRCDLDVPVVNGEIQEKFRLQESLETLKYITGHGGIPVIAGHLGKPDGKVVPELSTKILLPFYTQNLGENTFELLENLRFDSREEANDPTYVEELATKAELYVNESFSTCHRNHASITGLPTKLQAFVGFRLAHELRSLSKLLKNNKPPFVAIIGGAKLESKMPVVSKFLETADTVILGGKLALEWKTAIPAKLLLPIDYAQDNKDIGLKSIDIFTKAIDQAKTILWAGPMGAYEDPAYLEGTRRLARRIAELSVSEGVYSVIGGGDTIAAIRQCTSLDKFGFVSTGGGAMLQFLANGNLPGLEALGYNG